MKQLLLIVEGAQGVGKTTLTDYIRNGMAYTNLYRLSGNSDCSVTGKEKTKTMFDSLMRHLKDMENQGVNLVFDRTFFSEEVYTRLGYKPYLFTDLYEGYLEELNKLDYDIYFIILYLNDVEEFRNRLDRSGKAKVVYAEFDVTNSAKQQSMYLKLASEIESKHYENIKVVKLQTDGNEDVRDVVHSMFEDWWK